MIATITVTMEDFYCMCVIKERKDTKNREAQEIEGGIVFGQKRRHLVLQLSKLSEPFK